MILDGQTVYLRNGGRVILGDGLAVEIFADPYPQSLLRSTLDFYLTRAGSAVTGAGVGVDYDMLGMSHGPFSADATETGAGHYVVSLYYNGSGLWEQDITISISLQRIRIQVVVVVA